MRRILISTAAAVVAATALTIASAQAASYSVTLATSKTQADVGTRFTLSGKVTGKSSANKTVTIQRKIGSGAWSKLTTTKTTSKGTYSKKITAKSVGAKQYRVVAPKAGSTGTGTSSPVTVTGFTWLYLADQPTSTERAIVDVPVKVAGKTYKKSFVISDDFSVVWNLAGKCDSVSTKVAIDQRAEDETPTTSVTLNTAEKGFIKTVTALKGQATALSGATVGVTGMTLGASVEGDADVPPVDLLTPRAHCSTTQLPVWEGV